MRLVGILVALLIVGVLVLKQMKHNDEAASRALPTQPAGTPQVPTHADQVPAFNKQMNDYLQQQNDKQRQQIEDKAG